MLFGEVLGLVIDHAQQGQQQRGLGQFFDSLVIIAVQQFPAALGGVGFGIPCFWNQFWMNGWICSSSKAAIATSLNRVKPPKV